MSSVKRPQQAVIVSANALLDGAVVYYAPGGWTPHLAGAQVARTEAEAAALEASRAAAEASGEVVEPELFPVETDEAGRIVPSHYREKIRALGPTIRTDLGPQALGEHAYVSL